MNTIFYGILQVLQQKLLFEIVLCEGFIRFPFNVTFFGGSSKTQRGDNNTRLYQKNTHTYM